VWSFENIKHNLENDDRLRVVIARMCGVVGAFATAQFLVSRNYRLGTLFVLIVLAAGVAASVGYLMGAKIELRIPKEQTAIAGRLEFFGAGVCFAIAAAVCVFLAAIGAPWTPFSLTGKSIAPAWLIFFTGCSVFCIAKCFRSPVGNAINAALALVSLGLCVVSYDPDYLLLASILGIYSLPLFHAKR
jgi:hypothetical protein